MKKSFDAEEIILSNSGNDDDNFENFFVAIAEDEGYNTSGKF